MNHGQRDAWGDGTMVERRGRVVKAYPKPAHPMQQSRSAYLLSIRLEQHGLLSTPPAYVHLELKKCFGFLELQIDHVIGFGKALRSPVRNRELHRTTKSFCASDGVRARQPRKTADLAEIVIINQILPT